jgi:hypothetical protein
MVAPRAQAAARQPLESAPTLVGVGEDEIPGAPRQVAAAGHPQDLGEEGRLGSARGADPDPHAALPALLEFVTSRSMPSNLIPEKIHIFSDFWYQ